jgi:hypothetical protein
MEFARFGDSIVIGILPKAELCEDRIVVVDYSVSVAAVLWPVLLSECQKPVGSC